MGKLKYCVDCSKEIDKRATRCQKCSLKVLKNTAAFKKQLQERTLNAKPFPLCSDCGKILKSKNSFQCKRCWAKDHIGEANPSYVHGLSTNVKYPLIFNDEYKSAIRKRDNFSCKLCGIPEEEHLELVGLNLSIHHIDYDKNNSEPDNLVTLCNSCHAKTNFNRDYWKEKLSE